MNHRSQDLEAHCACKSHSDSPVNYDQQLNSLPATPLCSTAPQSPHRLLSVFYTFASDSVSRRNAMLPYFLGWGSIARCAALLRRRRLARGGLGGRALGTMGLFKTRANRGSVFGVDRRHLDRSELTFRWGNSRGKLSVFWNAWWLGRHDGGSEVRLPRFWRLRLHGHSHLNVSARTSDFPAEFCATTCKKYFGRNSVRNCWRWCARLC
jgi:hypothetical protein